MGMRAAPMAELVVGGCIVPRRDLLGRERAGSVQMLCNLEIERICLAAIAVGIAERCVREMIVDACGADHAGVARADAGHLQRHLAEAARSRHTCATSRASWCTPHGAPRGAGRGRMAQRDEEIRRVRAVLDAV